MGARFGYTNLPLPPNFMRNTSPHFTTPLVAVALSLLFVACASSPEEKVRQLEQKNEAMKESSGYNLCMTKVSASQQKTKDCQLAKIKAAGFDEWRDCTKKGMDDALCAANDNARYKAEVNAHNDCLELDRNDPESLVEGDCTQLLLDAMAQ